MFMQSKISKKFDHSDWTASKMLKVDFLARFLKLNFRYKQSHGLSLAIIPPKILIRFLNFSQIEISEYVLKLELYSNKIMDLYAENLDDIVLFFCLVELKYKIKNYLFKYAAKLKKIRS